MNTTWLKVFAIIAAIGAINWGLVGFFNWNLVDAIFGADPVQDTNAGARVVYAIVGIAGLALLFMLPASWETRAPTTGPRREVHP